MFYLTNIVGYVKFLYSQNASVDSIKETKLILFFAIVCYPK